MLLLANMHLQSQDIVCNRYLFIFYSNIHYIDNIHITVHVRLDFRGKQGNEHESPLFYFHKKGRSGGMNKFNCCARERNAGNSVTVSGLIAVISRDTHYLTYTQHHKLAPSLGSMDLN